MMTNDEAMAYLAQLANGEEAQEEAAEPQSEEANETPQEEAAEPDEQEATQPQSVDMTQPPPLDVGAMKQAMLEAMLEAQKANAPTPQMSEEELQRQQAREALLKELGLDSELQELQRIKAELEELKQAKAAAEQERIMTQLQKDIQEFKSEYHDSAEQEVLKHLSSLPPEMAKHLDNPLGWRLIADAKGLKKQPQSQQPMQKPDPIVSSNNSTIDTTGAMDKLRSGNISGVDAGNLILQIAQRR